MRTGQFAARYNLSTNGIRYYVEQGLLSPKMKGNQYDFDQKCIEAMEEIQKLKQMHYSLPEISQIFHIRSLIQYTLNADAITKYNKLFYTKQKELNTQIKELEKCVQDLGKEIIKIPDKAADISVGVPIECLPLLACPRCKRTLSFDNTIIQNNKILSANIGCPACGYQLRVIDGVIRGAQSSFAKVEWSNILNLMTEYSTDYLNLEAKSYYQVKENIEKHLNEKTQGKQTIITSGGFSGDLICSYPTLFESDTTIIIADQHLSVIDYVKDKMGVLNNQYNILYICDENFELPLRENSIDFFLDDYSSSEFIFYEPIYPFEKIRSLLKQTAYIGGAYTYYQKSAKTLANIQKNYPKSDSRLFCLEIFKNRLRGIGLEFLYDKKMGKAQEPGSGYSFDYHAKGDALYFYAYFGKVGVDSNKESIITA
ncbi:MerR family transcriptional regulator [Ihubacter massiliensis]|uniref:MerR family transcriptional regulator n=1 Tax=Hominibacterium faecale TaxID=2839743 RepID=A0A9J6QW80_9FIRM|nr:MULTISPECIES: MerR family transcriptional regulator [Eubacteriales Family XIII. Incertae Sedis]MCO7124054.1 MerR family transcriptional regulator [Ihubacter massiliensis]MCU7379046.1 MerR family transcriptional regulator [Hominibacterium faecale]MDE8733665.1 MerR family transcriptional regulator [Eubacteriales bacterium DFI.9.88]